jgi:hypothetical protein
MINPLGLPKKPEFPIHHAYNCNKKYRVRLRLREGGYHDTIVNNLVIKSVLKKFNPSHITFAQGRFYISLEASYVPVEAYLKVMHLLKNKS